MRNGFGEDAVGTPAGFRDHGVSREDGAAVEYPGGGDWYLNDQHSEFEPWLEQLAIRAVPRSILRIKYARRVPPDGKMQLIYN